MKIVAKILLKVLTVALILTGIGCVVLSLPIVIKITNDIAATNIRNAIIETIILIFVWAIGFMMAMFGVMTLHKGFIDEI